MKIIVKDLANEADKKKFVASIYASMNGFLCEEDNVVIVIESGAKLGNIGDALRGIADIIDCAKDLVVGSDDDDPADYWK